MIASAGGNERDVVMRLRLVADGANQSEAKKVFDEVAAARKSAGTETRTAIQAEAAAQAKAGEQTQQIDERVMQNRIKLLARIQKEQAKAREDEARTLQAAARDQESANKKAAELSAQTAVDQIKAQQTIAKEAERAGRVKAAAEMQFKEAAFGAARGALDAVRGMAILGLATEEDMQKFVKLFATIEGGYTLVRGLADVWFKGSQAVRQYQIAVAAASAQQAALNATTAAGGAAGAAGAAGGAVAPVGGMSAGKMLGAFAAVTALLDMLQGMNDPTQSVIFSFVGLGKSTEELRLIQQRQRESAEALVRQNQRYLEMQQRTQDQRNTATAGAVGIRGRLSGVGALTADDERWMAFGDLRKANRRVEETEDWRLKFRGSDNEQQMAADKVVADAQREVQAALERVADAQQRVVEGKREAVQLAERELATAERQVEAAQKRSETETRSFESRLSAFGQLNKAQQEQLKAIAERAKQGGITEQDARALQRSGFGEDLVRGFFAEKGRAAGGGDILGGLGERKALDDSLAELAKAQQERRDAEMAAAKATAEMNTAIDDLIPTLKLLEQTIGRITETENRGVSGPGIGTTGDSGIGIAERNRANARTRG